MEQVNEGEGAEEQQQHAPAPPPAQLTLAQRNHFPRDDLIKKNEALHIYSYVYDPSSVSISVSKFSDMFLRPFDAKYRIACMMKRSSMRHKGIYQTKGTSKYNGMSEAQIQQTWTEAADKGTLFHAHAEAYLEWVSADFYVNGKEGIDRYKALTMDQKRHRFMYGNESGTDIRKGKAALLSDSFKLDPCYSYYFIRHLEQEYLNQGWEPFRVEWIVHKESDLMKLAGTIDAVFVKYSRGAVGGGGKPLYRLADWKTTDKPPAKKDSTLGCYWPIRSYPDCKQTRFLIALNSYADMLLEYGVEITEMCLSVFGYNEPGVRIPLVLDRHMVKGLQHCYKKALEREQFWKNRELGEPYAEALLRGRSVLFLRGKPHKN